MCLVARLYCVYPLKNLEQNYNVLTSSEIVGFMHYLPELLNVVTVRVEGQPELEI